MLLVATGAMWCFRTQGSPSRAADVRSRSSEWPSPRSSVIVERLTPGGKAEAAGLRVGDRILTCRSKPLDSPAMLQSELDNSAGEDEIDLRFERDGAESSLRAPRTGLGIEVRPALPDESLDHYEEGLRARIAGDAVAATTAWTVAALSAARDGNGTAAAWLHTRVAQIHESKQRWDEASKEYRSAIEIWKPGTDDASRSRTLVSLARCNQQLADADAARRLLDEARRLDASADRKIWEGLDLHSLGMLTWALGDFESARRYFGDAVTLREQWMPGSLQLGESLNGMGAVAYQEGDLDKAEDYYRRSLRVSESKLPDSLAVADGLNNLGVVAIARGDLDAAFEFNSRSLDIRERLAPDSEALTAALTNTGIVEYKRGHLDTAQDYYTRSLAIHERLGPDSMFVARDLINLGVISYERGDLDAAEDHYSRSLTILERLAPESPDCMTSVYNLGMVASERGDWDVAQRNLSRALAYREKTAPDSLPVAETHNALGNLAFARSDLETAEMHYLRALETEERLTPGSLLVSISLHNLGGVASRRDHIDAAKGYYERALAIRERMAPESLDLASSLHGLADIAIRQHRPKDALPLLKRALETIESQRDHIHGSQSRALLLARYSEPYVTLQRAYLALGDLPSAFDTIERARARSLLEGLGEARAEIREGVEPSLLERERALREQLSTTDLERQSPASDDASRARAAAAEKKMNELLVEFEEIQGRIRRASPRYAALTQPQPLSLGEIQHEVLDENTLLLEYALGPDRSVLWCVSTEGIHAYDLPGQDEVDRAARHVHELLTARNRGPKGETVAQAEKRIEQADREVSTAASALSEMLLGPVSQKIGTKRLLIVADGALQYVPFGALPAPSADADPHPQAHPLIVDHEVISLPSASVLGVLRREIAGRERAKKSVAVLADPVLTPSDPRVKNRSAAPSSADRASSTHAGGDGGSDKHSKRGVARIEPSSMQRLRFSRLEAESILALGGDQGLSALDFAANKRTALGPELNQYRIVHLATHGLLDSQHPELSGIVLSLVDEEGRPQDGFLRLHEIYNLRLNADLVVLSACQTALGREVRGEGLVGLTRGFMYAGAARVIASLWSVQDKATAELMTGFYEAMLHDGQTPAAALRTAQVAMWKQGRVPYYWAAFVLQGEFK